MLVTRKFVLGVVLAVVVCVAGFAAYRVSLRTVNSESSSTTEEALQPSGKNRSKSRFTQLVAAKMALPPVPAGDTGGSASTLCQTSQDMLLEKYSLSEMLGTLEKISPESFGEKCGFTGDAIVKKYKLAEELCEKTQREGLEGEAASKCWVAFLTLRAAVVKSRVKSVPFSEISAPTLLANLVIEALFDGRMKEFGAASERLYEVVPNEPEVVNAVVTARFSNAAEDNSDSGKQSWARFEEILTATRSVQSGEALRKLGNLELASYRLRDLNYSEFNQKAQALLQEIPELRPDVEYLRASFELNAGKVAESTKLVEALMAEFPNDKKYGDTLAQIRQGKTKGVFAVSFDFQLPQLQPE